MDPWPNLTTEHTALIAVINGLGGASYNWGSLSDATACNEYYSYLRSLGDMYDATGSTAYLDAAETMMATIAGHRADRNALEDEWRSEVPTAWVFDYGGAQVAHTVWNGHILHEFARWCAQATESGDGSYVGSISTYAAEVEAVLTYFNSDWIDTLDVGGAYTYWNAGGRDGDPAPFNGTMSLGIPMALLLPLGYTDWLGKLNDIIAYFEQYRETRDGAAWWTYWDYQSPSGDAEDVEHGFIVADFMMRCCRAGLSYTPSDIETLHQAWVKFAEPSLPKELIDGTGDHRPYASFGVGKEIWWWRLLGQFSSQIGGTLANRRADLLNGQSDLRKYIYTARTAAACMKLNFYSLYRGVGGLASVDFDTAVGRALAGETTITPVNVTHAVSTKYTYVLRPAYGEIETPDITCRATFETDGAGEDLGARPAAVEYVAAEILSGAQVKVRWSYTTPEGGTDPADFGVYYVSSWPVVRGSPDATVTFTRDGEYSHTFSLVDGTTYWFGVTARTAGGTESDLGQIVGPIIAAGTGPATPLAAVESAF